MRVMRLTMGAVTMALLIMAGMAAFAGDDIDGHRSCNVCGMDRKAYGFSRMLIRYADGTEGGVCSLHCAVIELDADKDRAVKVLLVADRDTRTLIDAEKAFWVIGGSQVGVMSIRGKWAFEEQAGAERFIKANGGKFASFDEVMKATFEDMYEILR